MRPRHFDKFTPNLLGYFALIKSIFYQQQKIGSLDGVKSASISEMAKIQGITHELVKIIHETLAKI